jgi:urea transport system permease protein
MQFFLSMTNTKHIPVWITLALIFCVPFVMTDPFWLNKFSGYICFGILAIALSLSWGYGGILNLGQALSFGLGSYCMAMYLKLRTDAVHTGSGGLPDFMVWNNVETLPLVWQPFHSLIATIGLGILFPAFLAYSIGTFVFGGRVTGVFVAIITLAALVVVNLIFMDQQSVTGGFNGITDLAFLTILGYEFDAYGASTYFLAFGGLTVALILSKWFINSRAGLVTQAIRDDENRVRYLGFNVSLYQCLVMALSAAIAGLGGMIYTVVMEFASPTFLDVKLSLAVVIWCAVGGRQSIIGCFWGAVIINAVQGSLSESEIFLETWTLLMGLIFILVVLFLPRGLAGLGESLFNRYRRSLNQKRGERAA